MGQKSTLMSRSKREYRSGKSEVYATIKIFLFFHSLHTAMEKNAKAQLHPCFYIRFTGEVERWQKIGTESTTVSCHFTTFQTDPHLPGG